MTGFGYDFNPALVNLENGVFKSLNVVSVDLSTLSVTALSSDTNESSESINLLKNKDHKYRKIQTSNDIVKRGLLETIFGGVGTNPMPNSP